MAKSPKPPRDPAKHSKSDPARPTRAKAARPEAPRAEPALDRLLNPGIERGTSGMGSGTGLQPPPDNSFDRRADFSAAHRARKSTPKDVNPGFGERPQTGYAPPGREPSPALDINAELRKALGFDGDPSKPLIGDSQSEAQDAPAPFDEISDISEPRREKRHRPSPQPVTLGVTASMQSLERLLREGRAEFNTAQVWTPHRPPRPEKSEGGIRLQIKSDFEPKGDQPTAIKDLVEGVKRTDRTQVLLGVTGSGKTFTMAKVIEATQRPALVLAPNKTLAAQLYGEFRSFFPDNAVEYFVSYYDYYQPEAYVPRTDTYIEKESSINEQIDRMRHSRDARAAGTRRRHHRGFGVLHLRHRLGRDLFGDDLHAEAGHAHRPAATARRPGGAAIQAHQRFRARLVPGARRHHRHFPGALRGPRRGASTCSAMRSTRSRSSIRSPATRPTTWSSSRSTPTRTT